MGGESKARRRANEAVLRGCPHCIYCGGDVLATTVDHVPPIIMFAERRRPKGLEFAACEGCNQGTKHADLVAAMIGRSMPDATTEAAQAESKRIFAGIANNIPGLLQEMHLPEHRQRRTRARLPAAPDGGFLRANGPLVSAHMQTFATKIGFALWYETTKTILPKQGTVAARWFSNVDRLEGTFPQSVFDILLPATTLKQGRFEVSSQFSYQWRLAEGNEMGMFLATFRHSFAVLSFAAIDIGKFDVPTEHPMRLVQPGQLTHLLRAA